MRVGETIRHVLETVPEAHGTRVLIENTAGAGRTMGRTAEEIALMLAQVPPALRHRTGYGLDTCHLFAAGYDRGTPRADERTMRAVEEPIGLPRV